MSATNSAIVSTLKHFSPNTSEASFTFLSGIKGSNREKEKPCQLVACNDYDAVQCWLNEYKYKETTYRSYQKEAERLLLWCVLQHKKPLSGLTRDDFERYFDFLSDPQPKHFWCAPKGGHHKRRGEAQWKPFVKGLGDSAKNHTITIINSLLTYLVDARYLAFNPLLLIRKKRKRALSMEEQTIQSIERVLDDTEWHAILTTLNEMPDEYPAEKERAKFLIAILFFLGLRNAELEQHAWNAFCKIQDNWWFVLVGKGDKGGMIPVNDELLGYIIHYRTFLGKLPLPTPNDTTPIISSLRANAALSTRQVNNVIKNIMEKTAQKFVDQPEKAKKLKRVSAHWFRHQSATTQSNLGIDEKYIQKNLRHASVATTRKYNHARLQEQHDEMQKLSLTSRKRS